MRALPRCPGIPGWWILASLLTLAVPVSGRAQDSASFHIGQIVRFRLRGGSDLYAGRLLAVRADSLVLAPRAKPETTVTVARSAVARIWVSDGSSPRTLEGRLTGLLIGGLLGAVVGAGLEEPSCRQGELFCFDMPGLATALGAAVGVGLGTVVGGILGGRSQREQWRPIELTPTAAVATAAERQLGLTLRVPLGGGRSGP